MRLTVSFLLAAALSACVASTKPEPRLGILPDFDKPLCTEDEKRSLGLDECTRRLLAFVGRGVRSVVVLKSVTTTRKGETSELTGTGIIIDAYGRVLTAYSAVHDSEKIVAVSRVSGGADGRLLYDWAQTVPMRIKSHAARLNIALLEPEEPQPLPRPLVVDASVQWVEASQKLWVFGAPTLFAGGKVADYGMDSSGSTSDLFEIGVPVADADLGGAVVTPDGRIVGIVVGPGVERQTSYVMPLSTPVQLFGIQTAVVQDIGAELDRYLTVADWSDVGMCDNMRTTLYRITAPSGVTVSVIIPTTDDQFVDVKTESDGEETHRYFIKRRPVDAEKPVVVELKGMAWGLTLRSQSVNAYYFHYRLGQPNDCSMQNVKKK